MPEPIDSAEEQLRTLTKLRAELNLQKEMLEQQIAHRKKVQEVVRALLRRSMKFRDALIEIEASGDAASSSLASRALAPDFSAEKTPPSFELWSDRSGAGS